MPPLMFGAMAAAFTHFSATCCIFQSRVVVTWYPPVSMGGQSSAFGTPHRIAPSWWRTCHTKWGARHVIAFCFWMRIGSLNAAAICSSVMAAPAIASSSPAFVRCRFVVIWVRMKLRLWAILLSRGTARTHFTASLGSSEQAVGSVADFWRTAFLRRSNAVGDCGMPARIAAWAIVSLCRSVTPK